MVINDPATLEAVTAAFARYEAALMANDIDGLNDLFLNAPYTLRYGVGEMLYGFQEISGFRTGRAGGSPQRRLLKIAITSYGTEFATANTEFLREGNARIGRQSQSWINTDQGWKIVAAHVSFVGDSH